MKREAEYAIRWSRPHEYGGERTGDEYEVVKLLNGDMTTYKVTVSTAGTWCTCPAGQRVNCKHRDMVRTFREMPHNV